MSEKIKYLDKKCNDSYDFSVEENQNIKYDLDGFDNFLKSFNDLNLNNYNKNIDFNNMDCNNNSLSSSCNSIIFNTNEQLKYLENYNLNKQKKNLRKEKMILKILLLKKRI